jgi:hypothetical protein
MTKTAEERDALLASLGLNPSEKVKETAVPTPVQIDFRTMPVTDIVFDPADVAEFTDFEGMNRKLAADKLFAKYKSEGKNKDRHSLLWSKVSLFLTDLNVERKTDGVVKEKVKTTKQERHLAQVLAALPDEKIAKIMALLEEK